MLDLATVKSHLRVDHDDEDALIEAYLAAAISTFETWTNRQLVAAGSVPAGNQLPMTASVQQGVLLLVGHWYANREAVVVGTITAELPLATRALWLPHRWANI